VCGSKVVYQTLAWLFTLQVLCSSKYSEIFLQYKSSNQVSNHKALTQSFPITTQHQMRQ